MGVVSRRVLPACAPLCCCFCPGLRARSKKPIKRYNQFLGAIFKSAEEGTVNDKQIGKLAEYAYENPDRIPIIVERLEAKGRQDLAAGKYTALPAVAKAFSKLVGACGEHMSLIAGPALSQCKALMDAKSGRARALGCQGLADFLDSQADTAFAAQVDSLLPATLAIAREPEPEPRPGAAPQGGKASAQGAGTTRDGPPPSTKAAALEAIRAYICYTAKFGRALAQQTWDQILGAVLDSYPRPAPEGQGQPHPAEFEAARADLHAAVDHWRTRAPRDQVSWAQSFAEVAKSHSGSPGPTALTCTWALSLLQSPPATASSPLFQCALRPVLAYISNASLWAPPDPSGLGVRVLLDLRDGLRLVGAQLGREKQLAFQLIQAVVALLADPDSPVPPPIQPDAIAALQHLLSSSASPPLNTEAGKGGQSGQRHLERSATMSSGYAVGEVLCVEALAQMLARSLAPVYPSSGTARGPGNGTAAPLAALEAPIRGCMEELAQRMESRGEFLDALGVTVEGIPSLAVTETWSAVEAAKRLAPAVASLAPDARVSAEQQPGSANGSHHSAPTSADARLDVCPELLFNATLQVLSHPDPHIRKAAHELLASLASNNAGAPLVHFSEDQQRLLLSSLWLEVTEQDTSLSPTSCVALLSTFRIAIATLPPGSQLLGQASQLALSVRSKGTHEASEGAANASISRSLLSLASAMLLSVSKNAGVPQADAGPRALILEVLPTDPFLEVGPGGELQERESGSPGYATPEDRASAAQELAALRPKEGRLQPQRKVAATLATALSAAAQTETEEGGALYSTQELLDEFQPDKALVALRASYLSSNDFPPSASPSILLVQSPSTASLGAPPAAVGTALAEAVDAGAEGGQREGSMLQHPKGAKALPKVADLEKALLEPSSREEQGQGQDSQQSVTRALAILDAIA